MTGSKHHQSLPLNEVSETASLSSASLPDWREKADSIKLNFEFKQNRSRAGFQQFCKSPGVNLNDFKGRARRLLSTTSQTDRQQELAESLIRGLFKTAASTIREPQYREHFSNPELSDKQLIEALAFVKSPERTKCVRALLYLATHYPQIETFLEQKLNNILHFTSTAERTTLVRECLEPEQGAAVPEHARRILAASVDLEQSCHLIDACGKDELLALRHKGIRELVARSCLLKELRGLLIDFRQGEAQQSADPLAHLNSLEALLESAGEICVSKPACAGSLTARRMLKAVSSHLSELRSLRHCEEGEEAISTRVEEISAKLGFEFTFGIRLADERANMANTHRRWSVSEIEEASLALERIPEGRLLFTPKLHTIQRVKSLGDHILGMRTDNGTVKITDAAVAHPYVELAYRGMSSFQITLTHELGHAIQLGPEGPGLQESEHEVTIAPGDPCYNFKEFMQLSGWKVIPEDRYKIQDAGLSVELDGVDLPVGVPCRIKDRRTMLVYNQGLLMSYDTDAQFSLIDYSRTNPWEDWAESFCEYIMLPERLLKFAPQKFMYFEEEFRKYASSGVQALLKKLGENKENDDESELSQAA